MMEQREINQPDDQVAAAEKTDQDSSGFVAEALGRVLKKDFKSVADKDVMVVEALNRIESGLWPKKLLDALFSVLEELSSEYDFDFHHFGFLHPSRKVFDQATDGYGGELIENKLVDPAGHEHYRKYIRVETEDDDMFLEHALMGEDGDGRLSVHFDLVHEDAAQMLDLVKERLSLRAEELGATVFESNFGGGNAPVGRIGIRFDENQAIDVGVMFRTHYSDPKDWS